MTNNYRVLAENVRERSNPEHLMLEKGFSDELRTLAYSDVLTYIRLAMRGVEPEYTRISKLAGERVKDHLSATMTGVVFKYQGSIMTNTHIRSYSDIDLLTIPTSFYTYASYQSNQILDNIETRNRFSAQQIEKLRREVNDVAPYIGDPLHELRRVRLECEVKLSSVYSKCDISKPKSIKISNTNLRRDVDIVIANWYDDVLSIINDKGEYRGIEVYNKETHSKCSPDFPFLSIDRINERGTITVGRIKRMIRFLKNLKAKSEHDIKLSSFDFNAICYDIKVQDYISLPFYELVPVLYKQLKSISTNEAHSDNLTSVDGREYIFRYNSEKLQSLQYILAELEGVYYDLVKERSVY